MFLLLEKILPAAFNIKDCKERGFEPLRVFSHQLSDFRYKAPEWVYKYVSDNIISGYCINMFVIHDTTVYGKKCEIILDRDSLPYDLLDNQPKINVIKGIFTYPKKELKDMLDAFVEGTHLFFIPGFKHDSTFQA